MSFFALGVTIGWFYYQQYQKNSETLKKMNTRDADLLKALHTSSSAKNALKEEKKN